jgi:hypothetical protein
MLAGFSAFCCPAAIVVPALISATIIAPLKPGFIPVLLKELDTRTLTFGTHANEI